MGDDRVFGKDENRDGGDGDGGPEGGFGEIFLRAGGAGVTAEVVISVIRSGEVQNGSGCGCGDVQE